jgi:DNA polymerase III epsilon subunit-like protein
VKAEKEKIKYCCLDIETSDFDPQNGEILELGMVFFTIENKKIHISKEWTSVFYATKPVPPRILGLTNITLAELEDAPKFSEKSEEVQELVKDCVIVGHNVSFDAGFLEAFGLKFSSGRLDTLDLAQFILPMNKTYNLEALMGFFSIHYKNAHRALSDAKATVSVMEKMLGIFSGFSKETQDQVVKLFAEGDHNIFEILSADLPAKKYELPAEKLGLSESKEIIKMVADDRAIISFPLGFPYQEYVLGAVHKSAAKTLVVVANEAVAYKLWRNGIGYALFDSKNYFDREKFERALKNPGSNQERLFLAKIVVWQEFGWQSEVLANLNLSFFGNQYRSLLCGHQDPKIRSEKIAKEKTIVMDYETFIRSNSEEFSNRKLIIFDINNFEAALTRAVNRKAGWQDFLYALSEFKDSPTLNKKQKAAETQIASDIDLFFGLAILHIKKIAHDAPHLLVTSEVREQEEFSRVSKAATNFLKSVNAAAELLESERLARLSIILQSFFAPVSDQVYWIEMYQDKISFHVSPTTLTTIAGEKLGAFSKIIFTASLGSVSLLSYFSRRLALQGYANHPVGQQELRPKVSVKISKKIIDDQKLLDLIYDCEYPAALLLPNMTAVQNFYEKNFAALREQFRLSVQNYTGSTNKILENFSIGEENGEKNLLIATDKFILKNSHRRLRVKTLIVCRLPFEQFTHPFIAAQGQQYANTFEEFSIPRALYNFHSLIGCFYSDDLSQIYIADAKLEKEYGKYFIEYLENLPFVETNFI